MFTELTHKAVEAVTDLHLNQSAINVIVWLPGAQQVTIGIQHCGNNNNHINYIKQGKIIFSLHTVFRDQTIETILQLNWFKQTRQL